MPTKGDSCWFFKFYFPPYITLQSPRLTLNWKRGLLSRGRFALVTSLFFPLFYSLDIVQPVFSFFSSCVFGSDEVKLPEKEEKTCLNDFCASRVSQRILGGATFRGHELLVRNLIALQHPLPRALLNTLPTSPATVVSSFLKGPTVRRWVGAARQ